MAHPSERREFEWIQKYGFAAAYVTNHQTRTIAAVVTIDLDGGKFTGECHWHFLNIHSVLYYMRNSMFGSGSLLFSSTTFLYLMRKVPS